MPSRRPPVAQLALPFADPAEQVVQALVAGHPLRSRSRSALAGIGPVQDRLAERVHGAADVVGRLQRVGPVVVLAVPVTAHHCSLR